MPTMHATSDEGMRARLALAMVLLIAGCLAALVFWPVPNINRDALLILIGVLAASFKDVYGYSFGGSAGRDKQADTLNKVASVAASGGGPAPTDAMVIPPGSQATATATDAGIVIQKEEES